MNWKILIVCLSLLLSGCVSTSKYKALKKSFETYIDSDQSKQTSVLKHFQSIEDRLEEEEKAIDLLLRLQLKSMQSWQKRINNAKKYMRGLK